MKLIRDCLLVFFFSDAGGLFISICSAGLFRSSSHLLHSRVLEISRRFFD